MGLSPWSSLGDEKLAASVADTDQTLPVLTPAPTSISNILIPTRGGGPLPGNGAHSCPGNIHNAVSAYPSFLLTAASFLSSHFGVSPVFSLRYLSVLLIVASLLSSHCGIFPFFSLWVLSFLLTMGSLLSSRWGTSPFFSLYVVSLLSSHYCIFPFLSLWDLSFLHIVASLLSSHCGTAPFFSLSDLSFVLPVASLLFSRLLITPSFTFFCGTIPVFFLWHLLLLSVLPLYSSH